MLQLMTTPAQPAAAQAADALPAENPATLPSQDGALPPAGAFAALAQALVDAGTPAEQDALPGLTELPSPPADGGAAPVIPPLAAQPGEVQEPKQAPLSEQPVEAQQELAAEQWLLSMLGQQQTRIEAREAVVPTANGAAANIRLPSDGGLHRHAQALPAAPQENHPQPAASVPPAAKQGADEALAALLASLPGQAGDTPATALSSGDASSAPITNSQATQAAAGTPALPGEPAAGVPAPTHLQQQLKLESSQAKWGEQMLGALRDNVELQLQQKVQSATIRLDPPELGSLEILLSHDSGRLNVQISAANGDVARLLQQTSERLRQELVGQNFLQVNVQVSADSQSGQQGQQQARARWQAEDAVLAAAPQAEQSGARARRERSAADVLITV